MREPWKMPPIVKVYEAIGAIGDGRVRLMDERRALVVSSDAGRTYEVETANGGREVFSNDNASYWQGYLGYPAIAVLLACGVLGSCAPAAGALKGVPWKDLNRRFKNDYRKTLAEVGGLVRERGFDPEAVAAQAEAVLEALRKFAPYRGKRRRPPRRTAG